jgi:hypothetical protein
MPAFRQRDALALACGLAAVLGMAMPLPSLAGSATAPLGISLTITAGCTVLAPPSGGIVSAIPAAAVNVNCTSNVPYSVASYSVLDIAPDAKGIILTVVY